MYGKWRLCNVLSLNFCQGFAKDLSRAWEDPKYIFCLTFIHFLRSTTEVWLSPFLVSLLQVSSLFKKKSIVLRPDLCTLPLIGLLHDARGEVKSSWDEKWCKRSKFAGVASCDYRPWICFSRISNRRGTLIPCSGSMNVNNIINPHAHHALRTNVRTA